MFDKSAHCTRALPLTLSFKHLGRLPVRQLFGKSRIAKHTTVLFLLRSEEFTLLRWSESKEQSVKAVSFYFLSYERSFSGFLFLLQKVCLVIVRVTPAFTFRSGGIRKAAGGWVRRREWVWVSMWVSDSGKERVRESGFRENVCICQKSLVNS